MVEIEEILADGVEHIGLEHKDIYVEEDEDNGNECKSPGGVYVLDG